MRSSRQGAIPSELGWLIDELDSFSSRLRALEAPSGEALGSTVAKLQALIGNIQAQLDEYNRSRYTNAQIDAKFSAMEALIDQKVAAYVASYMAGNVQVGGALRVLGDAQVDGTTRLPGARNTSLGNASGRVTAWLAGDGRLGNTA